MIDRNSLIFLFTLAVQLVSATADDGSYSTGQSTLVSSVIYGILLAVSIMMLALSIAKRRTPTYESEYRPLILSPTPTSSDNITLSREYKSDLMAEVKLDEILAWAFEPPIKNRIPIVLFAISCVTAILGFASFTWFTVDSGTVTMILSAISLGLWASIFVQGCKVLCKTGVNLYGLTNKRVFMIIISTNLRSMKTVSIHSSDYEGLQQISMTRKDDGSGTLTFNLNLAGAYSNNSNPYPNRFAFENISNVSQVKDIIESYKSAHQKV